MSVCLLLGGHGAFGIPDSTLCFNFLQGLHHTLIVWILVSSFYKLRHWTTSSIGPRHPHLFPPVKPYITMKTHQPCNEPLLCTQHVLGYNTVNQSDKPPFTEMYGMAGVGRHKQAGNHNIGSDRPFSLTSGKNPTQFSLSRKATYCLVQLKYLREDFSFRYC